MMLLHVLGMTITVLIYIALIGIILTAVIKTYKKVSGEIGIDRKKKRRK